MLHVLDVPGFEYILIHCGNTDEHTAGCLLVGDSQENNQITKDGFIGNMTIPNGVVLVLDDNLSFDRTTYNLRMEVSGTSPILDVIIK